ncbi:MAG: CDP-diacylglycerol--glycerol-3-phosphate 3-phosphatidyltransferase [Alphaproteobacteria bacterium]|nr:CDP-diacylglycerol--glycerol-3-phosphate 3-phosphatidyltransferase [Alphaproteobacteria bacterium]
MITVTANHVTTLRIVLVPIIALCICIDGRAWGWVALVLFTIAAASDWLDGYLARKHNSVSVIGRVLDSIADKLLIAGCLLALASTGHLGSGVVFPAIAIVLREIFVSGLREYTAVQTPLPSTQLAKIKTAMQMVGVGMLIVAPNLLYPFMGLLGGLILWIAAVLSVYTGWQYWLVARALLIDAKQ